MAIVMIEGFEQIPTDSNSALSLYGWNPTRSISNIEVEATDPRFPGTKYLISERTGDAVSKNFGSDLSTFVIGNALFIDLEDGDCNLDMQNGSDIVIRLRFDFGGTLEVFNGNGFQLLGSTTYPAGSWFYLELKVFVDSSTGTVDIWINGSNVLSLTGVDTTDGSATTVNTVSYDQDDNGAIYRIDDVYVTDGDVLGDSRVLPLRPDGDGNSTQFTPDSGGSNFSQVNETEPDDDTSFVESGTLNDLDLYTLEDPVSTPATVHAVRSVVRARKTDTDPLSLTHTVRTGGSNFSGDESALGTDYAVFENIWEQNPNTTAAWQGSELTDLELGYEVTVT